jgi:DNA repair protein RecO (recombination protein O)
LLLKLTDEYDPHPQLFDAAVGSLDDLADGRGVVAIVLRFELTALRLLGHLPNLNSCVQCNEPVATAGRIGFGQLAGGVLCGKCRPGKRQVVSITAGALSTLRLFADSDSDAWRRAGLPPAIRGELRGVLNHYVSHLIGHQPRMHRYLSFLAGSSVGSGPSQ